MITRTISGVIGAILVIIVLALNQRLPMLMNILTSIACVLSVAELLKVREEFKKYYITIPCLTFAVLVPLVVNKELFIYLWFIYIFVFFMVMIFYNDYVKIEDIALTYMLSSLVIFSLSTIITLRDFGGKYGLFYMIIVLAIAWLSDTSAYFCGSLLGKHKLCSKISPKKTVEGAIGGVIGAILSILLTCFIFKIFIFEEQVSFKYVTIIILAFIGSILSIVGDLSFSLIKRQCNVKDFGNVIPGHGGILDRVDSLMFVIPYTYIFLNYFSIINKQ